MDGLFWGKRKKSRYGNEIQQISEIAPSFAFTEFDFYKDHEESFKKSELGIHRMRTKYLDVSRDNTAYVKQRRHTQKRTRKMIRRLLDLLGKILAELRKLDRENPCVGLFSDNQLAEIEIITKICRQQRKHHESGNAKESTPDRIVSVNKPYVRPIVRGKENCESGTQPGCLTTYPSDINTSYKG